MQIMIYEYHKKNIKYLSVKEELQAGWSNIWPRIQHLCKTMKAKCHTESKPYIDFRCEVHFDV